jgi:hypothetical protein
VAKKKGTRKAAPRGARKKATVRRVRKAPQPQNPRQVNLKPLQKILRNELERLEKYERTPEVERTMTLLRDTQTSLTNACINARIPMVIDF